MATYKEKVPQFGKWKEKSIIGWMVSNAVLWYWAEQRQEESRKIIEKYPDKVPIICEKAARSKLPDNERSK